MNGNGTIAVEHDVAPFDRIALHVHNMENELFIRQGPVPAVFVEAREDVAQRLRVEVVDGELRIFNGGSLAQRLRDALSTSLSRARVRVVLTVKTLSELEITGFAHAQIDDLETQQLRLKFSGVGGVRINDLRANRLDVDLPMPGPTSVEVSGCIVEQRATVGNMGQYNARGLESRRAMIALTGPSFARATVWVQDELDVSIRGAGTVEYYGQPRLRQEISPMGSVTCLGAGKRAAAGQRAYAS